MKNRVRYSVAVAAVLSGAAITGQAFTLGDLRGGAVIGRSLDVSVPIVAGPGEEVLASCVSAEVLFGDLRQLNPSIVLTPVNSDLVAMTMVRIKSGAVVNEPVVSVVLRSTCGSTTTRHYVLLADFPAPDLPTTTALPAADRVPLTTSSRPSLPKQGQANAELSSSAAMAGAGATAQGGGNTADNRAGAMATKPAVKKRRSPLPAKPAPAPEPVLAKPVLKLDLPPALTVPTEIPMPAALPASSAASAPDDAALQQAARIEALQNDIQVLKELALKNEARLGEMQVKLRQAEAERVPMSWFYLLLGLLVAALGALAWVWRKRPTAGTQDEVWWQQIQSDPSESIAITPLETILPVDATEDVSEQDKSRFAAAVPAASAASVEPYPEALETVVQVDQDIDLDIDLDNLSPAEAPVTASQPLAIAPVDGSAVTHNIHGDNISDIRQQAEFFVSLGQTDRALNVLRKQIMENADPNPLVYLDLLTLYHAQGLKSDFRELRAAFNRFFNGVVPDFPAFSLEGSGLLDYPEPLAVLVRFWPKIEAIAFLEACIFHNDAAPMQLSFDLAAFRDLLILHAVAEKVTSDSPWPLTQHGGLASTSTVPAELAGFAMVMDMRDKAAATIQEDTLDEDDADVSVFRPLSVEGPPSNGLDLDFPAETGRQADQSQPPKDDADDTGNLRFEDTR